MILELTIGDWRTMNLGKIREGKIREGLLAFSEMNLFDYFLMLALRTNLFISAVASSLQKHEKYDHC